MPPEPGKYSTRKLKKIGNITAVRSHNGNPKFTLNPIDVYQHVHSYNSTDNVTQVMYSCMGVVRQQSLLQTTFTMATLQVHSHVTIHVYNYNVSMHAACTCTCTHVHTHH